jgi:two-component system response regulator WspF
MRIAIVNDLAIATEALRRVIRAEPGYSLAWTAVNGADAIDRCRLDTPDLILMDLVMPIMDGAEATRRIMSQCPCGILVVTAALEGNIAKVFEALGRRRFGCSSDAHSGRRPTRRRREADRQD